MSDALLDYSSWSFQVIFLLIVLYLVVGLMKPAWVGAGSRRTIAIVSVVGMLLASTAFYVAVRPLDGAPDGSGRAEPGRPSHNRARTDGRSSWRGLTALGVRGEGEQSALRLPARARENENRSGASVRSGETSFGRHAHRGREVAVAVAFALAFLYLVVGLIRPSWAWATKRRSVVLRTFATNRCWREWVSPASSAIA